jgi:hypothetical protein
MIKTVISLATTLVLFGCATQSVDSSYVLNSQSGDGVITGSISYAGRFSGYGIFYKNLATGETGRLQIGESQALLPPRKSEFEDPHVVGMVFAVKLPAGDYEVFRWTVGSGIANVSSIAPFEIKFKVEPGKLAYIGSFQFKQTSSLGLTVTGVNLAYKDAASRDLTIMRKKFPNLAIVPLSSLIAEGTDIEDVGGSSTARFTSPTFIRPPMR